MENEPHSPRPRFRWTLALAVVLAAPAGVLAGEPLETIREAFRASSQGLTSGIGKGTFRHYEAIPDGDWQLKRDADVSSYFAGNKYHAEFVFHRDEVQHEDARRIIHDGRVVMGSYLAPEVEGHFRFKPEDAGDGTARPYRAGFPWDLAHLSRNVWDPELLIRKVPPRRIEIRRTPEGDLVGSHPLSNTDRVRVRFECPRRFGFNLSRLQIFHEGQPKPVQEARLEWRQNPAGLWYVRSLDETRVLQDVRVGLLRVRDVLKYTEFEPNAKVDPRLFTEEARRIMGKNPINGGRPDAREPGRREP